MNKIRIIGLALLIIGISIPYFFENDGTNFISGILLGLGAGLLITGTFGKKRTS